MKHLIFGAGNLGIDLKNEIIRQGGDRRAVTTVSLADGLDVRDRDEVLRALSKDEFDVIWYCVGQGSVNQAKENRNDAALIYGAAPRLIVERAPRNAKVILFSTDYVADEEHPDNPNETTQNPLSLYASIRRDAETFILRSNRPNTAVVRVGSLYGTHKPDKTFPGRILASFGKDSETRIRLPQNLVTPSPTLWLASILVTNLDKLFDSENATKHHAAPLGNVSVWDWGTFVLKGIREPSAFSRDEFFDEERPKISALGCSFLEQNWHWSELWKTYFKPEWFTPPEGELSPAPDTETSPVEAVDETKA